MKGKISAVKTVVHSMISTLLVMTLLVGLIVVEKNTRKIGFADSKPWIIYKDNSNDEHYLQVRVLDDFYTLDFTGLYTVTDAMTEAIHQAHISGKIQSKFCDFYNLMVLKSRKL